MFLAQARVPSVCAGWYRTFILNRERAVDYLNMLERIYVFDGFAGWDPEVWRTALLNTFNYTNFLVFTPQTNEFRRISGGAILLVPSSVEGCLQ